MTNSPPTRTRDIVVIGCSAGGVEALPRVLHPLPVDLPVAVFIVQHMAPTKTPYLVDILSRATQIPVGWAEQGDRIQRGRIYVAPPDVHLIFTNEHLTLTRGARENHARPSIDKLFRSAAAVHGSRTIGVLLTGMLDDGVAGLRAIRETGGFVIIQDPDDAAFPELPSRALQALAPDRMLPLDRIASTILAAAQERVPALRVPEGISLEAALDRKGNATPAELERLGPQSAIACPECQGPMWQLGEDESRRYRCYLGHVVTAREVLVQGTVAVEAALWSAVRALNERAMTLETLARDSERSGNLQAAETYTQRAQESRTQADLARQFMLDLVRPL